METALGAKGIARLSASLRRGKNQDQGLGFKFRGETFNSKKKTRSGNGVQYSDRSLVTWDEGFRA